MELLIALLLVFGTGFFAGSETAVYRAQWVRLATWQKRKVSGSGLGLKLLAHNEACVVAALVGTNLCGVFASMLVSRFCAEHLGLAYAGVGVVVLVALTLVFGEYLPKAYATAWPNRWLRLASWPLAFFLVVFAPAVFLLVLLSRLFGKRRASTQERLILTRQDFLSALRQREPAPGRSVSGLAARLFRSSATRVSEASIPLRLVRSVPDTVTEEELLALVREYGFSRVPVYRQTKDNIVGVILARDLLSSRTGPIVRSIERLPAETRIMEALERMQRRAEHMAAVTDRNGRVTGMVTLEDILEELVGEIRSED